MGAFIFTPSWKHCADLGHARGKVFIIGKIQPMNWLAILIMCLTAQVNAVGIGLW